MLSPKLAMHHSNTFLPLFILLTLILLATSEITNISFPQFYANDTIMKAYGDIQFNAENHSWIMNGKSVNTSIATCAMLSYSRANFRVQDSGTGKTASFSTSFAFKIITPPNQSVLGPAVGTTSTINMYLTKSSSVDTSIQDMRPLVSQPGACQHLDQPKKSSVSILFRTIYNSKRNEPSNNFIAINDQGVAYQVRPPGSTYNLCGGNRTHCSYLSSGDIFTTWIDFTPQRTLQVRLMNGSHPHIDKPLNPLFEYLTFKLPSAVGDYLSLNFIGSSSQDHIEAHELFSWSFYSSGIQKTIPSSKKTWIGPVFGAVGAFVSLVVVGYLSLWYAKHCRVVAFNYALGPHAFSYKELCIATKDFSDTEKLGSGAFGTVYKGSFQSEGNTILLAVKRLNFESKHAEATFLAEISTLSQIRHGNVVQLQGWCHEKGRLLLVYDYMSNGGLDEWLHESSGSNGERKGVISLRMRHQILMGVAVALEYLHKDCPQCVLHRDIKSSNVMLDADLKAHLGDFGLARLMDHKKLGTMTTAAGTIGYMAPEIPYTGKATKESDVYSFGILVLEVLCGRRPLDWRTQEPEDLLLLHYVWRAHEGSRINSVVDSKLLQIYGSCIQEDSPCEVELTNSTFYEQPPSLDAQTSCSIVTNSLDNLNVEVKAAEVEKIMVKNLLHLGLVCCLPNPKARPSVEDVICILQEIGDIDCVDYLMAKVTSMPPIPDTKPLGLYRSMEFSQTGSRSVEHHEGLPMEIL